MKKQRKAIKKWMAAVLVGTMVMGTSVTSLASSGESKDSKLYIEFGDLNDNNVKSPFDYHGVDCYYVKPGNNEFKFVKEKSMVSDIGNLDYGVNILVFDENSQEWKWCELGGDMTVGDFEYDKIFKMIIPEVTKTGFMDWTYDFSKGEDMTKFTDNEFKGYCDENGYKYSGETPDWVIHVFVNNEDYTLQWDWYFKSSLVENNIGNSTETSNSTIKTSWMNDEKGWWVIKPDGSYITNAWYQSPESSLWYYMGVDGYMLNDTITPDGFNIGTDGVWIQ